MRYTITISSETDVFASPEMILSFRVDIRKLIPQEKISSKFLLKSSFSTSNFGDSDIGHLVTYIRNLPRQYNTILPETSLIKIGSATPKICQQDNAVNVEFCYSYNESECNPVAIDYPELSNVELFLVSMSGGDIPANQPFDITLVFEELN